MAASFDLFQAPPSGSDDGGSDESSSGGLDLFTRPDSAETPSAPTAVPDPEPQTSSPAPQSAPEPSSSRSEAPAPSGLDLFTRPPERPRGPSPAPEPEAAPTPTPTPTPTPEPTPAPQAEPSPAPSGGLDLFTRPDGAPSPTPTPTPTPTPSPQRGRGRRGPRQREDFEGEEMWQRFLDEKHEGGRSLVIHPDPVQRRRRRNYQEPRVRFNTAMRNDDFRAAIGREYEAWKGQQQQDQGQSGPLTSFEGLERGTVLQGHRGMLPIKVDRIDSSGNLRYHWKKEDGSWSGRTRRMAPGTFRNYRFQRVEEDTGPRLEIGGRITDTSHLRAGDFVENAELKRHGRVRKVLEVLPDGRVKTQKVDVNTGRTVGDPEVTAKDQLLTRGRFDRYEPYSRVEDPTTGVEERQRRERAERERREQQERTERERREQQQRERREQQQREQREQREREQREERERARQDREEQPHIGVGETLTNPRQLRVGDIFRNNYLQGQGNHREVVEIKPDGRVMSRIVDRHGREVTGPTELKSALFRQHGPYKRFVGLGSPVGDLTDVGPGSYVKKDGKTYRVVHRTTTGMFLQDVHQGRGVGRPVKVLKAEATGGEYKIAPTPRQAETGQRIKAFGDTRVGQVLKAMHHRTPKWVRVESIGADKIKVQPVNAQTGEPEGEAEELSKQDLKRWAYLAKTGNLPEALLPPLVPPPGGFARPGEGPLVSNSQAARYDDVTINLTGATKDQLRRVMGLSADQDPTHVLADLAGAGGLAKSLSSISLSASLSGDNLTVSYGGRGDHITGMSRTIKYERGNPTTIYNSYFELSPSAPKGMGLKAFATQVATARDQGFESIGVEAAGSGPWQDGTYNGYYVWARFGYDKEFSSSYFSRMPASIQADIRRIRPEAPRNLRFLDVMEASKAARDWWKDNGRGSNMRFDTTQGSRNLDYLTRYVREVAQKDAEAGADQYLNRAAKDKSKGKEEKHEWYPTFGPDEEEISDRIWDAMGEETRKKNKKKDRKKKAARILFELASDNTAFRKQLLSELNKA